MMCGKCGAELIGSGKFCASCGAPTAAAPSSGANLLSDAIPPAAANPVPDLAAPNILHLPDPSTSGPPSNVNPFAATAAPKSDGSSSSMRAIAQAAVANAAAKETKDAKEAKDASDSSNQLKIENKHESAPPKSETGPPPMSARAVSPLALSNGVSGRTPFGDALEKARQSVAPAPPVRAPAAKKPGTQIMQNAPLRSGTGNPASEPPVSSGKEKDKQEEKKRNVPKTVAMDFNPAAAIAAAAAAGAPRSAIGTPNSNVSPSHNYAPPSSGGHFGPAPGSVMPGSVQPGSAMQPSSGYPPHMQQPQHPAPPQQPPPQPWAAQTPQPASRAYQPQPLAPYQAPAAPVYPAPQWGQPPASAYGYGFAYVPGARVQVTWSNGQRYPATLSQVNGSQCLVVFPDGQQHWVDMQYLSPG